MSDNDEIAQVREMASRFFSERAPVGMLRQIRDEGHRLGYRKELWQELAALGIVGTAISEECGGAGVGYQALGAVFEQAGRNLSPIPLLSSSVLCASAIELSEASPNTEKLLAGISAGQIVAALAMEEGIVHSPYDIGTRADPSADGGYVLNGQKTYVVDGFGADKLLVLARTSGEDGDRHGLSLFVIGPDRKGVTTTPLSLADSRNWANIEFKDVALFDEDRLGAQDLAADAMDAVLDRARLCLAAEMLGSAIELFERTLDYLKNREQFGQVIGSFQAMKHRAVVMFTEIELTKSAVRAGLAALDTDSDDVPKLASLAKARANDTLFLVSNESIQMHGGVGVTDELDIGLFLKRARTSAQMLGQSQWHRDRYAQLSGY